MNLHYQYWVDYYEGLYDPGVLIDKKYYNDPKLGKNTLLINSNWDGSEESIPPIPGESSLFFKVLYPGLLTGIGYDHDSFRSTKDAPEIQLGITLDFVTGLPFIPGSEVKGMLRSAFIADKELIKECLGSDLSDDEIHRLEVDMFGKTHMYDPAYEKKSGKDEAGGKDVFFDAFPVKANNSGRLIGLDYITSHIATDKNYQGLIDVNPITMLKVMPGVTIQFRFKLSGSSIKRDDGTDPLNVSAEQKLELFRRIISDYGIGAKTNTGFGLLEQCGSIGAPTFPRSTGASSAHSSTSGAAAANTEVWQQPTEIVRPEAPKMQEGIEYTVIVEKVEAKKLKLKVSFENGAVLHGKASRENVAKELFSGSLSDSFAKDDKLVAKFLNYEDEKCKKPNLSVIRRAGE